MVSVAAAAISVGSQRLDLRGQRGVRQTRADALGDVECGGPARHVFDAAVGQFHMNIFSHDVGPISCAYRALSQVLVVVTGLEEIDTMLQDPVNQPVFLSDSPRPATRESKFEGFGFANAFKRVS